MIDQLNQCIGDDTKSPYSLKHKSH